jgi:hypothetical protein
LNKKLKELQVKYTLKFNSKRIWKKIFFIGKNWGTRRRK